MLTLAVGNIMKNPLIKFTIFSLILLIHSCGSSSDDAEIEFFDPSGTWQVTLTNLVDECELFPSGFNQIEDQQTILVKGNEVSLSSSALPLQEYTGTFRSNNSFTVQVEVVDDLFAAGFNCRLSEKMAYDNLTADSADVLYEVKIVCDDGSRCDTGARGIARRL